MSRKSTTGGSGAVFARLMAPYEADPAAELEPQEVEMLRLAADHLARAEQLDRAVTRQGQTPPWGLGGRPVLHPGIPEMRACRSEAGKLQRAVQVRWEEARAEPVGALSASERNRANAAKRWQGRI